MTESITALLERILTRETPISAKEFLPHLSEVSTVTYLNRTALGIREVSSLLVELFGSLQLPGGRVEFVFPTRQLSVNQLFGTLKVSLLMQETPFCALYLTGTWQKTNTALQIDGLQITCQRF